MKIALEVTSSLDQKKRTIIAAFPDFIAFEQKFSKSVAKFEAELTLTDLGFLAWHSEHRTKRTGLDFDYGLTTLKHWSWVTKLTL